MKAFQKVIDAMGELEKGLIERERFWAATQIKVLRGFVSAIMLGEMSR
jgi:hypothetical protein